MTNILSKILMILIVAILLLNMSTNIIYAAVEVNLNKAYMEKIGEAKQHLKYYREDRNVYTYLVCSIVGYYDKNGNFNPSYCMNRDLVGAENESYYVTVDSLLDNDEVWRVIKNGYPYKSASKLGLTSKYDAYAVTKWAVYCILGEAELSYFKAEKDDDEAVAMLKALKKLVDIGKNGREKQDDNPISLKKVGTLKEEGEYFSQEYKVESTSEFNSYEVSKITGMPEGTYISDTKGKKNTVFNSNSNFKVMIPKIQITDDLNINITVKADCKSYIIMEGKTTVTKTQNYVITAGEYATATATTKLKKVANTAKIVVNKIAEDTKIPMQGVKFKLYDEDGELIATKTTDETGKIEFTDLYPGKYKLLETKTNSKYILKNEPIEIQVEFNESKEITIENERKKGNIKVNKVDKDNNQIKIEGVKFDIYSEEQQKVIGTYTTDKNGEINITDLPIGEYRIIEKSTNKWYNLADEVKVQVKYNETTEATITNEAKKGQVKVIKVDSENNNTKIPGVKFNVLNKAGEILETITTDSNGEATTSKYPLKDFENLYLKEIETDKNYILNEEIIEVKLEEDKIKNVVIENEKKKGNIKICKVDQDNQNIKIEGAKFELYDNNSEKLIGTYTTDKNGEIYVENLPIGIYKIKEIATNKWYNFEEKENEIEVKYNETTEITITNEAKKGQIKLIKVDSENDEIKIAGVKFEVQDKDGNVLETITTDENGEALTSKYAIKDYKNLYLKEIETSQDYELNEEIVEVKLESNKTKNITIRNEKAKGSLKIYKVDKDNEKIVIEGAKFDLYNLDKQKLIGTYVTDKNGEILVENLTMGNYKLTEKSTNNWYNLEECEVMVEIKPNKITETTITNEAKKGQIKIIKVDSENNEVKLAGVKFEVQDEYGNVLEIITTDENGEALTSKYAIKDYKDLYLKEIETNEKYVLNDEKIKVKLIENETQEIIIKNDKIKGKIKIIKTSKDENKITKQKTGTPLSGVKFEIYNSENNYIETITTDKNGIAITSDLEKGEYKIKEIETNKYYYLNQDIVNVAIEKNQEVKEVSITNESKNPDMDIEKVGPDTAEVGSQIEYDISIRNTGNTCLDNFTLTDIIPADYIKVTKFKTGTYNQNISYNLYYKTNLSNDEYVLMMEDLDSRENYEINFETELADNEYVTEIKLEFGRVDTGFASNENPHITAVVNSNVRSEDSFINTAEISAEYDGYNIRKTSKWKTIAYKFLPKTGL